MFTVSSKGPAPGIRPASCAGSSGLVSGIALVLMLSGGVNARQLRRRLAARREPSYQRNDHA